MTSKFLWRAVPIRQSSRFSRQEPYRCFSCALRHAQQTSKPSNVTEASTERTTHFGFETVPEAVKQQKVASVFSSVASSYDTMNDLMSLYVHRLWKDYFVRSLDPGSPSGIRPWRILDIAGGTGDIAFRMLDHASTIYGDHKTSVTVADINPDMLAAGRRRALNTPYAHQPERLCFVQANAEDLYASGVEDNSIDLYTVAFGIRNFTNKPAALREAYRVLKPGGVFACLEFSKVRNAVFNEVYKRWSFGAIPLIGQLVAGDRASYQYLVESIEKFPAQAEWRDMIREAGFVVPGGPGEERGWENLTGGIAAVHKGLKPIER